MKLKRMVTAVLPSILVDAVRERRRQELRALADQHAVREAARIALDEHLRHAASNVISWDEACHRARGGGYATRGLSRFRVARARLHVPDGSLLQSSVLGMAARLTGRGDIAVTDFGGSAGEMGADFLRQWPRARYCVVENPQLVARLLGEAKRPGLSFVTEIPNACDIFYCSGALQYLANPMEVWSRGLRSARHGVVLRRNNFAESERFDVQTSRLFENGHGALPDGFDDCMLAYPRRTLVEDHVHAMAARHGFACIANLEDCEEPGEGRYSRQLVFWRKEARGFAPLAQVKQMLRRIKARAKR